MDKNSNHIKNILHGFFLSVGTTIAEPSTILPLIVNYFGGTSMLVGFFASLLRGGAILVQLFAAFQSQSYAYMLPYIRRVFFIRFLAWFFIGVSIILFFFFYPKLTLFFIGIGKWLTVSVPKWLVTRAYRKYTNIRALRGIETPL